MNLLIPSQFPVQRVVNNILKEVTNSDCVTHEFILFTEGYV